MTPRLWGRASSVNVQKVMWALAELDLPHERIDAGGRYGRTDSAAFARLNPNRRVPVWEEDGLVLWESHAILRHLANRHGAGTLALTATADQWMEFTSTTLQPPFLGVFWQAVRLPGPDRSAEALARHLQALDAALDIVEARLGAAGWLDGDAFSAADIAAGSLMYRYFDIDIPRPSRPALTAWYGRLASRTAYAATVMTSYDELRA